MFVKSLYFEEFKGIKKTVDSIDFSHFNILIGRNNSGKSAILEALSLLPKPDLRDSIENLSKIQKLRNLHGQGDSNKALIYLYSGKSYLKYDTSLGKIEIELELDDFKTYINERFIQSDAEFKKYTHLNDISLDETVLFIPDNTNILYSIQTKMEQYKELLTKKGFHIKIAEFLNKTVSDRYTEIVFLHPISLRKQINSNTIYLPLSDLGSGAERIVKIMAMVEAIEPKLLLIDDFGGGFHPTLIKMVLEWLNSLKTQIIITTHSIDVLNLIRQTKPKETNIIFLNKDKNDYLNSKVFSLRKLEDYIDANLDPRYFVDKFNL